MKLNLVVLNAGKSQGQTIPINLAQFIIGRDPQCNLRPASAVISKRHCAVLVKNDQVFVRDFESTNGTFVNDIPVKGEHPIQHEDVLKVGPLMFRVVFEVGVPVTKPTPVPTKPASVPSEDDSVAAMLLSIQDDGASGDPSAVVDESSIPAGSTVMDIMPLSTGQPQGAAKTPEKKEDKKKDHATAHLAAKALLDKYTRRPRTPQAP